MVTTTTKSKEPPKEECTDNFDPTLFDPEPPVKETPIKERLMIIGIVVYLILISFVMAYHLLKLQGVADQYKENSNFYNSIPQNKTPIIINREVNLVAEKQVQVQNNFTSVAEELNATALMEELEEELKIDHITNILNNLTRLITEAGMNKDETNKLTNEAQTTAVERDAIEELINATLAKLKEYLPEMENASSLQQDAFSNFQSALTDVEAFRQAVEDIQKKQDDTQSTAESGNDELDQISEITNNASDDVSKLITKQPATAAQIDTLWDTMNTTMILTDIMTNIISSLNPKVAFSAYMASSTYTGTGVVPFTRTRYNPYSYFCTSTYKFKVPVDGVYIFGFSLSSGYLVGYSTYDKRSIAYLMKNSQVIASSASINNSPSYYNKDQAGNMVIVRCKKGDTIYLQTSHSRNLISSSGYGDTTFSGALLFVE